MPAFWQRTLGAGWLHRRPLSKHLFKQLFNQLSEGSLVARMKFQDFVADQDIVGDERTIA